MYRRNKVGKKEGRKCETRNWEDDQRFMGRVNWTAREDKIEWNKVGGSDNPKETKEGNENWTKENKVR